MTVADIEQSVERRAGRRWLIAAIVVLLIAAVGVTWVSWPRGFDLYNSDSHADAGARTLRLSYLLHNGGDWNTRIMQIGSDAPGTRVVSTDVGRDGVVVASHRTRWVRLTLRVVDCRAASYDNVPLVLRISRWYGVQTVRIVDPGVGFDTTATACGR